MNGLFGEQNLTDFLPEMLTGEELYRSMECLPEYNINIRNLCQANRLIALNDLYKIYLPNEMSVEIYSKLYLAMVRSLQKKSTNTAIQQQYHNANKNLTAETQGLIGGSDCFSIIGASGIGKSASISRAVSLLSKNGVIEFKNPYLKVIPCVIVQCPFDCSAKGLLLEILRVIDSHIGTSYFEKALKSRTTADMMLSSVAQVLLNHIGILIVDEIQNVVHHRNGRQLVSMLTQLINSSGISICMVGTPEVEPFFSSVNYLARRTLGLKYSPFHYGEYFEQFCKTLFEYQYVRNEPVLTEQMINWLYEHSNGTLALVVTIIHDAQEIAILNGKETIDIEVMNQAYQQRMGMIQGFVQPTITKRPQTSKVKKPSPVCPQAMSNTITDTITNTNDNTTTPVNLYELSLTAKNTQVDIVELLSKHIIIEEVVI